MLISGIYKKGRPLRTSLSDIFFNYISYSADAVERDEITELRQKLDDAIHSPPVEEAQIRSIAMQLAALRLNAIGMEEYETIHLHSLFRERNLMTTLDQELLHESVRQVTYMDGVVSVLLKNKQLLKGGPVR